MSTAVFFRRRPSPRAIDAVPFRQNSVVMDTGTASVTGGRGRGGWFHTTQWTMVSTAGNAGAEGRCAALEQLCETYWRPVYCYARQCGLDPADAQDLTQEFFSRFLQKNYVGRADRERGRFRTFLLTSARNFLANERRRSAARKRGGGKTTVSLDAVDGEHLFLIHAADGLEPDVAFEKNWAITMLENAMACLQAEYERAGKGLLFRELRLLLWDDAGQVTYAQTGERLSMSTAAVKMAVSRLRRRARDYLLREIAHTVATEDEIEDEFRHLRSVLSKGRECTS